MGRAAARPRGALGASGRVPPPREPPGPREGGARPLLVAGRVPVQPLGARALRDEGPRGAHPVLAGRLVVPDRLLPGGPAAAAHVVRPRELAARLHAVGDARALLPDPAQAGGAGGAPRRPVADRACALAPPADTRGVPAAGASARRRAGAVGRLLV